MTRCEKFLEVLKLVGHIASTILKGIEEYRKIQDQETYKENRRKGVKYLPYPQGRKHHRRR